MQNIRRIFPKIYTARTIKNSQKGATMVEFAIIASLLFLLLFGIIEFGVFLYNKQVITNASREGARAGIISRIPRVSEEEIRLVVNNYCQDHLVTFGDANDPETNIKIIRNNSNEGDPISFGDDLEVTVTFNYGYLFLHILPGIGNEVPFTAVTVMKYE